jgi:glucose/arabinose dehydrogenase
MYVAVGSASNVAEQMGPPPRDFVAFKQDHSPGSAWGREEWRANVLTYDPEGRNKEVYASGIRNCSGLAVQSGTGVVYCASNERDMAGLGIISAIMRTPDPAAEGGRISPAKLHLLMF